jgi:hypothetical protein
MDPTQAKVIDQIDEREIVGLASELIKIPSFKLEETPVATFLAEFFGGRGYEVDYQEVEPGRFQTIATLEGTDGAANLGALDDLADYDATVVLPAASRYDRRAVEQTGKIRLGIENMCNMPQPFCRNGTPGLGPGVFLQRDRHIDTVSP